MVKRIRKKIIKMGKSRGVTIPYTYFDQWVMQNKEIKGFKMDLGKNILLRPIFNRKKK